VIGISAEAPGLEVFQERALARSLVSYLLGWVVAFGPALFIVLFDWRGAREFLSKHRAALFYLAGVAALAWAGSLESERHALNYASPVVYLLLGRTIEKHLAWFTPGLAGMLLASQALVSRAFLTTPQPASDYREHVPRALLTPLGDGASYLHLFPDYVAPEMVWILVAQYATLGAVILAWLSRRAFVLATSEKSPASVVSTVRPSGDSASAGSIAPPVGAGWRRHRANALLAVGIVTLGTVWLTYRSTRTPVREIKVRWAEGMTPADRVALQRQLAFRRCLPESLTGSLLAAAGARVLDAEVSQQLRAEARTEVCELLVWHPENLAALVQSPGIEDTSGFDRGTLTIPEGSSPATGFQWIVDTDARLRYVFNSAVVVALVLLVAGLAAPSLDGSRERPPTTFDQ
jgi:hypothetical protein